MDPITFSLNRQEIDARLARLDIATEERPPAASLNSTLGALRKFQDKREFQLLEWMPGEDTLYIVKPSFLFYVRWRKYKERSTGRQLDMFEDLLLKLKPITLKMLI